MRWSMSRTTGTLALLPSEPPDRYHVGVATLEAFLAAIIAAQSATDPPPPEPREVAEAAAVMGLLSDPEERWFRPAVSARGGV